MLATTLSAARERLGLARRAAGVLLRRRSLGIHVWLSGNPYHEMMYSAFDRSRSPERLKLLAELDAFTRLPVKGRALWIHSEASFSWGTDENTVEAAFRTYLAALKRWTGKGGTLIWTVHDTGLHLADRDPGRITAIRQLLADKSSFVHVHSEAAARAAVDELGIDPRKIAVIAHPSYALHYPQAETTHQPTDSAGRSLLCFGYVKPYKNFEAVPDALLSMPEGSFASLTVAGKVSSEVDLQREALADRTTLRIIDRFIDDAEVPALFQAADFLVLPYKSSLTSGVAALAMGFGLPVIASRLGGMAESVPAENHPLLFDPEEPDGLRKALVLARDMGQEEYAALRKACIAHGERIHPAAISRQLLTLFEERALA